MHGTPSGTSMQCVVHNPGRDMAAPAAASSRHTRETNMKIATFRHRGRRQVGLVDTAAGTLTPLAIANVDDGALALLDLLASGAPLPAPSGAAVALDPAVLEAPLPRPRRNVFCVGLNYRSHAAELAARGFNGARSVDDLIPPAPVVFSKVPESVIGPGAAIEIPATSSAIDYEAELAVVIGRAGKSIARAAAMQHVWGHTIVNDVTARDLQKRHQQWLIGKSCDTFCPMGPWIASRDEFDADRTPVRLWVNDELRQDGNTSDLVFDVAAIIESLSSTITLRPGDVIATGTPAGVGMGFDPPRWLRRGDRVRIEIGGIGRLDNPVL
jgi:2-keto-4-pentenoate hydratase/2-oxohepta-3-ene-1,7-dioic acid hydratase in catechol pathway